MNIFDGEFDWFGIDMNGCIIHFSSAGYGTIPLMVREKPNLHFKVAEYLTQLPKNTEAIQMGGKGNLNDWLQTAQRGLFSYDFKHWSGPYAIIYRPVLPINLENLSNEIKDILSTIQFENVSFKHLNTIDP